jgi:hypothetical protein
VSIDSEKWREMAAKVLELAHALLLQIVEVLNSRFSLGKDDLVRNVAEELDRSWGSLPENQR